MAYTFKHGDRPLEGITVQRAVGRGGFGEVYYALTDSGKQVALKYLRENPEIELRGIAHVMNLKSPYLITIYDVKRNPAGEPFVIMEYVGGPSLRELMVAQPGGMGVQKAAFFLTGIAKGLAYLHERGIVHRDLKPANIFYDDGYVKIGDYGLSKHISVSQHSGQTVSVGTVHYMAPEIGSGNYTKAIDIYALGVILYEMLTGRLPYSGASMAEILMRHLRDNPDLSGIPAPFAPVIAKALAKDPNDRYQDADEMLAAVMESADVTQSLQSFDVSSLSQVERSPEASDSDATLTSPHRPQPVPPLDARAPAQGWEQAATPALEALPERLQRKLEHLSRKLEQKAARLERKLGPGARRAAPASTPVAVPSANRRAQVFVLLAITAAIAVPLGLLLGDRSPLESRIACMVLFLAGGTIGPLLAHLRFLQRALTRSPFVDRVVYASAAGLFMLPAFAMVTEEIDRFDTRHLAHIFFAPLAAILLCDWGRRIESGRLGRVNGRLAFWPGAIGLVAANIVGAGEYGWTAAGLCAAIALLTQAAAALWPHARAVGFPGAAAFGGGQPAPPNSPVAVATSPAAEAIRPPDTLEDLRTQRSTAVPIAAPQVVLIPRPPVMRAIFGVLGTCAAAVTCGAFFALVAGRPADVDTRAGLLFATLAGVAWAPFLLCKIRQQHKLGLWRGTLRMLLVSGSLTLTAGMITLLAYADTRLNADEIPAAIFGLVAGAVIALVAVCIPGCRTSAVQRPVAPSGPQTLPPAPVVVSAAQPSFAGRTANAGLSFLGKLLLLAGLILALGQDPLLDTARKAQSNGTLRVGPEAAQVIKEGFPRGAAFVPLGLGSLLLVIARRRDGADRFIRACVGCALLCWGAVLAVFWSAPALRTLFTTGDVNALNWTTLWIPLLPLSLSLAAGGFLLLWPKPERDRPVVI